MRFILDIALSAALTGMLTKLGHQDKLIF